MGIAFTGPWTTLGMPAGSLIHGGRVAVVAADFEVEVVEEVFALEEPLVAGLVAVWAHTAGSAATNKKRKKRFIEEGISDWFLNRSLSGGGGGVERRISR